MQLCRVPFRLLQYLFWVENRLQQCCHPKVVDGDTLKIKYKGNEESIRLIGIDTPESKANKKAKKDAQRSKSDVETITSMGKKVATFTATLVKPGDKVKIEFDIRPRDQYGRLLGYC